MEVHTTLNLILNHTCQIHGPQRIVTHTGFGILKELLSIILVLHNIVVSAGGQQAINASSPARTLRSVAEREQLGVMVRGKWLYNTFGAMKQKTLMTPRSTSRTSQLCVRIESVLSGLGTNT